MKRFVKTHARALGERRSGPYKSMQLVWALGAACASPGVRAAEEAAGTAGFGAALFAELVAVVLIAIGGWVAVMVLRKRRHAAYGGTEAVRVVGGLSLGTRERVVVLSVRGRHFLVGATAHQISLLAELDARSGSDEGATPATTTTGPA
jgi:flagellar protein FliO/FliZ